MSAAIELAVNGGSAVAGAAVGLLGAIVLAGRAQKAAATDQRRRAYGAYLGALYPIVAELRSLPNPPDGESDLRNELIRQLLGALPEGFKDVGARFVELLDSEAARYLRTRRAVGDRPYETSAALAAAYAQLQVLDLDKHVRTVVSDANEYVIALGTRRTPEQLAEWSQLHARLDAARSQL
jgi:hypothetical protein